ncbi:MAG: hypothetical protein IK077_04690, partial [Thermoguttaceae bacterium]|nr:hypothetical protein [Thermoguttaceae bacterium]
SEPSVPLQQSTSELLDTFVKGTIFTTERTGGSGTHLVTAENEKYKLVAESWRYTEPRHNKAETLHYLEKIARNYSADSDAFAKMTHKSASKIIRWQYETFKDFIVKSALWSSTSDAFRELLDKALQNVESCFKIDVEKDDRDETNNFSCKEELERIPRFFPYYLAFVALFLLLSGVLFYQNKLIMGGCLSIVSLLGVVTFLILRETSWGRCEEAVRADYDRIKQFQLNKALSALALEIQRCRESLRIALGAKGVSPLSNDDEKVNNLRTFALNVQEALTRKTHGRIPRFPNMRLFPKERVPELFNYLNQKYELTNDIESFKELLARVTKESLNDESKESDYVEKQIDEYCKTRLWKYLNNLELSFFLRENFDDARMNHNRLREIIIPDYNDIYARGALIQKIVDDDEEEKRRGNRINKKTLTRKYLFAPEGINIERAHNYNKIVTNWKQACLAGQFWQLYDPTVHMNDKVITEEKTKEEVKLGTCEITAETEVVQNASTTRETRGNNAPDRKAFNEE